jgi:hypothetical protein
MNPTEIKNLSRAVSVMAVLGWASATSASVLLHRGWWVAIPAFNMVMTLWLAIALHQTIKRA